MSRGRETTEKTNRTSIPNTKTNLSLTKISESRDATTILRETSIALDSGTTRSTRAATKRAGERTTTRVEVQSTESKEDNISRREAAQAEATPRAACLADLQSTTAATTE